MPPQLQLQRCCGCLDLRRGSIAIGIALIVIVSIELVLSIVEVVFHAVRHSMAVSWPFLMELVPLMVHLLFSVGLVYGVRRERRALVLSWIVYHGIMSGLQTAGAVILAVLVCMEGGAENIALLLTLLVAAAVYWYWLVVVIYHHQQMQTEASFAYRRQADDVEAGDTEVVDTQQKGRAGEPDGPGDPAQGQ